MYFAISAAILRSVSINSIDSSFAFSDRKTQTTKNLSKLWEQLSPASSSRSFSTSNEQPIIVPAHSAMTTLLVDDSPLKARLQPYNHLCIPEYSLQLRRKDLYVLANELASAEGTNQDGKRDKTVPEPRSTMPDVQVGQETTITARHDETLLAVIGVLEELKYQSNVAGWIRTGRIWGPLCHYSLSPAPIDARPAVEQQQDTIPTTGMWFDHQPTLEYWVKRGLTALDSLGIEVVHGIKG